MASPLIVRFEDESAVDPSLVGGQGANLGRLARAEFDVPRGLSVTTAAYRAFLESAGLKPRIEELLAGAKYDDPGALETLTHAIREVVSTAAMPDPLAKEICREYAALGDGAYVAVRSSGTAEDLAGASFAGLHDTFLDVRGNSELVDTVKRCWASLWSSRAVSYRHTRGYDHFESLIAVVVQLMIESEVSGVMFTGNPVTAATDEILINASWGLGEAIVQGIVTPDEFTVQLGDLGILDRTLGTKKIRITRDVATGRGTVTLEVPQALQSVFCLSDESVRDLASLGRSEVGGGVLAAWEPIPDFAWSIVLTMGTVLDGGESPGSTRAMAAAGHAAAMGFHFAVENRLLATISRGEDWHAAYRDVPNHTRHLALHDQHLIGVNDRDRPFVTGELLSQQGLALSRTAWRDRLEAIELRGGTEVAYQPAGPDIPRELEAFASLFHS